MSDLYSLRQANYQASGWYHAALGEYVAVLHPEGQKHLLKEKADKCLLAAEEYRARLTSLLNYLTTAGSLEVEEDEVSRIRRLIELLDLETECIKGK